MALADLTYYCTDSGREPVERTLDRGEPLPVSGIRPPDNFKECLL